MIIIATHTVFLDGKDIFGPPHAVSNFLNTQNKSHLFIKHPLDGKGFTLIQYFKHGKLVKEKRVPRTSPSLFKAFLQDFIIILKIVAQSQKPIELFIGVDPLNTIVGLLLKFVNKTQHVIYFSADFAIQRFEQFWLNWIYHSLDRLSMYFTDQTWSVSQRIVEFRRKHFLEDKKNKWIPNAPFFQYVPRLPFSKKHLHRLVLVSALEQNIDFDTLLQSIHNIRTNIQDVELLLIGSGSQELKLRRLAKKLHVENEVQFLGSKTHEEMFDVLKTCGAGIALYTDADPTHFRYFSDPMKVRDYLASGLPVFISGNSGINEELEKNEVGFHIDLHEQQLTGKIISLFNSKKQHKHMHDKALQHAQQFDTELLLKEYLVDFI